MAAVAGAVGKWESRGVGGISKRGGKVGFWYFSASRLSYLYFHRPLHRGLRVRNHASHGLLLSPPEKRTDHVLSQPDISCANDNPQIRACLLRTCGVSMPRIMRSEVKKFLLEMSKKDGWARA